MILQMALPFTLDGKEEEEEIGQRISTEDSQKLRVRYRRFIRPRRREDVDVKDENTVGK